MVKIISNIDISVSYERERGRIKKKVESIYLDIEKISKKFNKLKDRLEGNLLNLDLIDFNVLKFAKFQKGLIALWEECLRKYEILEEK